MQLVPGSFDTKLLTLMSAALDAAVRTAGCRVGQHSDEVRLGMARSVIAAAGRGERDPAALQRIALAGVEAFGGLGSAPLSALLAARRPPLLGLSDAGTAAPLNSASPRRTRRAARLNGWSAQSDAFWTWETAA